MSIPLLASVFNRNRPAPRVQVLHSPVVAEFDSVWLGTDVGRVLRPVLGPRRTTR